MDGIMKNNKNVVQKKELMMKQIWLAAAIFCTGAFGRAAQGDEQVFVSLERSLVRVAYTLQYSQGESPTLSGWGQRCPNCGQIHSIGDAGDIVREERPLEIPGFVLAADRIVCPDMMVHPRFVRQIEVVFGQRRIAAQPVAYMTEHKAVMLKLDEPLAEATPLVFDGSDPNRVLLYAESNGLWTLTLSPLSSPSTRREDGRMFRAVPSSSLLVDQKGRAVSLCFTEELAQDKTAWGNPLTWKALTVRERDDLLAELEKQTDRSILLVKLNFRSPTADSERRHYYSFDDDEDFSNVTEFYTSGIVVDPNLVLIGVKLDAKVTARLERITLYNENDEPIAAEFAGSLEHYGAFLAKPATPLPHAVKLADAPIYSFEHSLLLSADVRVQGEKRTTYFNHARIAGFSKGWRGQLYPNLAIEENTFFLFDSQGQLVAAPLARRLKAGLKEYSWYADQRQLTAGCYLKPVVAALEQQLDAGNVPLTEEEEHRLAWLGTELQALDKELARINKVSHLTQDGQTGALVAYVYAGSPAERAGLEPGDILLRLHVDSLPKPLDIEVEDTDYYGNQYLWDQIEEIPDVYFDELPAPWPSADNTLAHTLTDLGFGTAFRAELFRNGQTLSKEMIVEQSPPHYIMAKRVKSDLLGLTVRDMTYEVRRYFQMTEQDDGVIVSKIEPGSKASVAGVKPYDIIIQIDNEPVGGVGDFERIISDRPGMKLSIRRMNKGRVITVRPDAVSAAGQGILLQTDELVESGEDDDEPENTP